MAKNGLLQQNKFLTELISQLDNDASKDIVEKVEKLRKIITEPSNFVLYIAGNLDYLKDTVKPINDFLPLELVNTNKQQKYLAKDTIEF